MQKSQQIRCLETPGQELAHCMSRSGETLKLDMDYSGGYYFEAFAASPAVWLILDAYSGKIVDANMAAALFYGYSIETLKAMDIFQIAVASAEETEARMSSVRNHCFRAISVRHRLQDASIREVEVYSAPLQFSGRTLLSSLVIDVTARKQAEEEVKRSHDRLSMVLAATQAGIWEWDVAGQRMVSDGRWKAMLGYGGSAENSLSNDWKPFCHPEDIDRIQQAARDSLSGKTQYFEVDCRVRRRHDTFHWVHCTGQAVCGEDGQPVRWIGSIIDIDHRKQIETLQTEREMILRDFARVISDSGFIIDEDGRIIDVFAEKEEMLLIPKQQLHDSTIFDLFPAGRAKELHQEIKRALLADAPRSIRHEVRFPEGDRMIISRMAPMSYTVNNKKTVAVVMQDVTEQEKARQLLRLSYEIHRRSDFINDLLSGVRQLDEESLAHAVRIGLDLSRPLFCCILSVGLTGRDGERLCLGLNERQSLIDEVLGILHDEPGFIAWGSRDAVGVLCQESKAQVQFDHSGMQQARYLQQRICRYNANLAVVIGIGEEQSGIDGLKKSVQQAWEAIRAKRCGEEQLAGIMHYRDLGILKLLVVPGGQERTSDFIRSTIGKLIDYDREKQTNYLDTLDAILHSANLRETAHMLYLHHNTLVFRKQRIEKILGVSISDFETKLAIAAAIKLYKMYESR